MKNIKPVSRWISVQYIDVTEKHSLYCYADKTEEYNGKYPVSAFRYNNRWYALNQFINRYSMWGFDPKCEEYPAFICGYDGDGNIFNPLLLRMDEYGEKVRLYIVE